MNMEAKTCTKCGVTRQLTQFAPKKVARDGLQPQCKECDRAYQAAYRAKNKEALRAYSARYVKENAAVKAEYDARRYAEQGEAIRARVALYRAANPGKVKAWNLASAIRDSAKNVRRAAEWSKRNPQKARAAIVRWSKANPEAARAHASRRRALKRASDGRYTGGDVRRLFTLQRGKCACCRASIADKFHVDHVVPLVEGGSNGKENIQLLCPPCNLSKGRKDPVEFMRSRGFLL